MSGSQKKDLFSELRDQGHRLNSARKNLIEFILAKKGHWTIQDLTREMKKKFPRLGVATVYRTVSLLWKNQLLVETRIGGGAARYESSSRKHHDHLTCQDCGEIFEFENDKIEELQKQVAKRLGFVIADHKMELFGHCRRTECKRANSVTPRQK